MLYGYVDDAKTLAVDPDFAQKLEPIAKEFHLAKHTVLDGDAKEHLVTLSPECKVQLVEIFKPANAFERVWLEVIIVVMSLNCIDRLPLTSCSFMILRP